MSNLGAKTVRPKPLVSDLGVAAPITKPASSPPPASQNPKIIKSQNLPLTRKQTLAYYRHTQALTCIFEPASRCQVETIDKVFKALADPSRRQLLDRLHQRGGQTLNELCAGSPMTRQAISQHLALLEAANLVAVQRHGREKLHFLNPVPIHEIYTRWIRKFDQQPLSALHNLKISLERNPHDN